MFGRYSERAQKVIILAQDEARRLNYNYCGTEHLLLGLLREHQGIAAKALENMGVELAGLRTEVEKMLGRGTAPPAGELQFTPRSKKVIMELAIEEARQLGHAYVGTEHLLLGILREGQCAAARLLDNMGADVERTRLEVTKLLGRPMQSARPPQGAPGSPGQHSASKQTPPARAAASAALAPSVRRGHRSGRAPAPGARGPRCHAVGSSRRRPPRRRATARGCRAGAREATGVELRCGRLLWVLETIGGPEGALRLLDFVYLGEVVGGNPKPEAAYFARADLPPNASLPPGFWEAAAAGFAGHDPGASRRVPEPEG